jgi:hypothetical protein
LDAGLILSTIVIFFTVIFPGVEPPQWWGNVKVMNTTVSFALWGLWCDGGSGYGVTRAEIEKLY